MLFLRKVLRPLVYRVYPDAFPCVHVPNAELLSNQKFGTPKHVVLLFGWGGAKQRNLQKVIRYYMERNTVVISSVMPMFVPGFIRHYIELEVLQCLRDEVLNADVNKDSIIVQQDITTPILTPKRRLFCHLFSNNGSWSYASLCVKHKTEMLAIEKLVFDSAPALNYESPPITDQINGFSRVLTSIILRRSQYEHFPVSFIVKLFLFPIISFRSLLSTIFGYEPIILLSLWLRNHTPNIPTLFLYSQRDQLVTSVAVEDYMRILKERGISITTKRFDDDLKNNMLAPTHVGAFYQCNREYVEELDTFLFSKID